MIKLDDYDIFRENKKSLRELSKDDSDPNDVQYMTDVPMDAVDFDKVKRIYANRLGLSEECAASADALMSAKNRVLLIEFKNGKVNNRNVKDKVRDSVLLFCDITEKHIADTRENVEFVLVYNPGRNPMPNQVIKARTQESASRDAIGKHFMLKANQEYIRFDLERYKRLYFKDVHTYSVEEFEGYLEAMLQNEVV